MNATPDRSSQLESFASPRGARDFFLVAIILGMMGLYFWAIRGTGGFGGSAGGLFAGLGWGLLWFTLARLVLSPRNPLAFAASRSIRNGIRGWAEQHGFESEVLPYLVWPSLAGCIPDLVILTAIAVAMRRYLRGRSESPLPGGMIAAILGLFVVLGYAVTLRWPLTVNKWVLITAYTTAIVASLLAYRTLWRRLAV